eukprot:13904149-Heterocapsa_arctica.AAC.1
MPTHPARAGALLEGAPGEVCGPRARPELDDGHGWSGMRRGSSCAYTSAATTAPPTRTTTADC